MSSARSQCDKTGLVPVRDGEVIDLPRRSWLGAVWCSVVGHDRGRPFWWTTSPEAQTFSIADQRCERCGAEIFLT